MKFGLGSIHCRCCPAIIASSNAFPEIIGLNFSTRRTKVVARKFPVNLIMGVGHEHGAADNSRSWRSFHHNFDAAEQDIEVGPNVREVFSLVECELSTIGAIFDGRIICEDPAVG